MRQKFVFMTAIAVCLTLALVPALADERTIDRHGDRTKSGKGVSPKSEAQNAVAPEDVAKINLSSAGNQSSSSMKAASMLEAVTKADPETSLMLLQTVTRMELESSAQNDAIRSRAYELLADQYRETPSRQVMILGKALQFASDSARRTELETKISDLGGDVFAVTFGTTALNDYARRDPGADDSCLGAVAVSLPHAETMSVGPQPDHNWRSFDLLGAPGDGHFVTIETISDMPGTGTDDTDLALWDGCPENDGNMIAFNQDIPGDFTSRIESGCLRPGTYYVEVGGFFDISTPDNFDLEIEITGTCEIPLFDSYEPDNSRANAAKIGFPTPTSGYAFGRANSEIQSRSMVNPEREDELGDVDWAEFSLNQNSLMLIGTDEQFPTFFNGFTSGSPFATDTIMGVFFENEPDYGGRCNQSNQDFMPACRTDADCPDPLDGPLDGLPPCIPYQSFPLSPFSDENAIAINDDRPSGGFGSELEMCLPRTAPGTKSSSLQALGGDFLVQVTPWRAPGTINYVDPFDYELQVKNQVGCLYEVEDNGLFFTGQNPIAVGQRIAAMYDFAATAPAIDRDHYIFDVNETSNLLFETHAPPGNEDIADTIVQLIIGPSDFGGWFFVGADDDNSGPGLLSSFEAILPPANALLGNQVADANYVVRIFSQFAQPNFYYEFEMSRLIPAFLEVEPNDTEATAQVIPEIPSKVAGNMGAGCDYDVYQFTLTEATFMTIFDDDFDGGGTGDGGLQVTDCSGEVFGCDEDGGPVYLSILQGCLPAGTYCAKYRPWNGSTTYDYEITFEGTPGCTPEDPPQLIGDEAGRCAAFDSCS
ncbi:MAG: hypothetical protein GTN89_00935 [Acidobacteria bacterium]|nr:hypothetical protein [Acidobacteriota bacterium]NIM60743.1 hypothetical protein [Acidobacteriota bacterium]NIO57956.1 hypothetical protein [Acidobacteriota bacterium]NIQ28961.1 hypothetical protein [Acidobacteriota bacterium]NIQ83433.1 hypothetical protein [Acidobacteriota bacterium]